MADTETTLAVTVENAAKGDRDAFRALFERLEGRLFAYAAGHLSEREQAIDVVQDTFIALWEGLPKFQYRSDAEFFGFVFTILKRQIMRRYGMHARTTVSLDAYCEELGDHGEEAALRVEAPAHEDHRFLMRAIERLSGAAREVIMLRYWSELSHAEIAATLGISESAAKVRHHRAVEALRAHMQGYEYA